MDISNSHITNIECNPAGRNKGSGLLEVCGMYGIDIREAIAVGDSLNDVSMIRAAGLGIAMGNAQEVVKQAADEVTLSNEEDGVSGSDQTVIFCQVYQNGGNTHLTCCLIKSGAVDLSASIREGVGSMNHQSFSIVIIPDTQTATRHHPHMLEPMARWIVDHAQELNVKIVLQLGDIVDSGATREEEFTLASHTMNLLQEAGIPFLICPGNHDYDNQLSRDRSLTMFNRYFGPQVYNGQPWFGGMYEGGGAENLFVKLDAEGRKLLVLALEWGPRDEVLEWADQVLEAHRGHEAIVITHCYMNIDGTRTNPGHDLNPKSYPGSPDANDGDDIWNKSIRKHPNVIAVFSGHHVPGNVSYRVDLGEHGNPVFQSFQNWQFTDFGGEGRFRVMTFYPEGGMELSVVNPQTEEYEDAPGYGVRLPFGLRRPPGGDEDWESFRFP